MIFSMSPQDCLMRVTYEPEFRIGFARTFARLRIVNNVAMLAKALVFAP